jgi:hypothetical protein
LYFFTFRFLSNHTYFFYYPICFSGFLSCFFTFPCTSLISHFYFFLLSFLARVFISLESSVFCLYVRLPYPFHHDFKSSCYISTYKASPKSITICKCFFLSFFLFLSIKRYIVAAGIQSEIILENSCAIFAGITMYGYCFNYYFLRFYSQRKTSFSIFIRILPSPYGIFIIFYVYPSFHYL